MLEPELESIMTIPDSWILLFKLKGQPNWRYIDCEEILDFPYARELIPDTAAFQTVKKHQTKVSWNNEKMDICIDRLVVDGIELYEK